MTDFSPINVPDEISQVESVFVGYRNNISIYTEDEDKDREFYIKLFKRLLNGTSIVINDVHPLTNKDNVIKMCKKDNSTDPKIYIVDGDIFLQFEQYDPIENLFRLDAYCIENYVLDCNSVEMVTFDLLGGIKKMTDVRSYVKYEERMKHLEKSLIDLFYMFSIQAELDKQEYEMRHTSNGVNESFDDISYFLKKNTLELDVDTISTKIDAILSNLLNKGFTQEIINEKLLQRKNKYGYSLKTLLTIVSGKDFLIPYWIKVLNYILNTNKVGRMWGKEFWKYQLAGYCDLSRLTPLKEAIIKAVESAKKNN